MSNHVDCDESRRLCRITSTVSNNLDCVESPRLCRITSTVSNPLDCVESPRLCRITSTVSPVPIRKSCTFRNMQIKFVKPVCLIELIRKPFKFLEIHSQHGL
ncbi:hypothetical protein HanPSC8_Chr11g0464451 [Helianthus annuus]|nr:hypothetical protein HanPSC8_Chr11g0464451 [Helianthus annuus]